MSEANDIFFSALILEWLALPDLFFTSLFTVPVFIFIIGGVTSTPHTYFIGVVWILSVLPFSIMRITSICLYIYGIVQMSEI